MSSDGQDVVGNPARNNFKLSANETVMSEESKVSDDYLETLKKVKGQYQEYVEISKIYELPVLKEEETVNYRPPSPEYPLTTNALRIK